MARSTHSDRLIGALTLALTALLPLGARAQDVVSAQPDTVPVEVSTDSAAPAIEEAGPATDMATSTEQTTELKAEPAKDPASNPPPTPMVAKTLDTRVVASWKSELFLSQRPRLIRLSDGRYAKAESNYKVFPFYNTIGLRAEDAGLKGLSINFQGWAGLDLADIYFDQRFVADPTYLYLQYRNHGFDARLGRQLVYTGAARGLKIDGLQASWLSPIHLGVAVLGGLTVSPDYGPDWYREQKATNADDYGDGFSNWAREAELSDFAFGGRVFYQLVDRVEVGVGLVQTMRDREVDQQLLNADANITPFEWGAVYGDAAFDLVQTKLAEANLGVDVHPIKLFSATADYRHANPVLFLSRLSIFSVFSDEEYDAVGGTARVFPLGWLALHAGYHHRFYSHLESKLSTPDDYAATVEQGHEIAGGVKATYGDDGGIVLIDYRRLSEEDNGFHGVRFGVAVPLTALLLGLKVTADAYLDVYDQEINGATLGLQSDVGLFFERDGWHSGGVFTAALTPIAESELKGMLKVGYNFDFILAERRQP